MKPVAKSDFVLGEIQTLQGLLYLLGNAIEYLPESGEEYTPEEFQTVLPMIKLYMDIENQCLQLYNAR